MNPPDASRFYIDGKWVAPRKAKDYPVGMMKAAEMIMYSADIRCLPRPIGCPIPLLARQYNDIVKCRVPRIPVRMEGHRH